MNICQLFSDFKGANNTWAQGHFRPASFIYAFHETQMEVFNIGRAEWQNNQVITDNIRPFFKTVQIAMKDFPTGAIVLYPKDYSRFSSLRYFTKDKNGVGVPCAGLQMLNDKQLCRELTEEEKVEAFDMDKLIECSITKVESKRWAGINDHEFLSPSIENPACNQNDKGFAVMPRELGWVVLDYLSTPQRPKMPYSRGPRREFICDTANCSELLWGDEMLPEFMSRLKTKFASFIGNAQKYAEAINETERVGS